MDGCVTGLITDGACLSEGLGFELQCGVADSEVVMQLLCRLMQNWVSVAVPLAYHEMGRESNGGGIQRPNMQIMHARYAGQAQKSFPHGEHIDIFGHTIK